MSNGDLKNCGRTAPDQRGESYNDSYRVLANASVWFTGHGANEEWWDLLGRKKLSSAFKVLLVSIMIKYT